MLITDLSSTIIQDEVFERLTTFPNTVITGHEAFLFLTREALQKLPMSVELRKYSRNMQIE